MPKYSFTLNKKPVTVDVPGDLRVLWVLRDVLGLTGTKYGCSMDECRACTVLADGRPFASCSTPVSAIAGHDITTIEGLADGDKLHPVQEAWLEHDVPQCGYCQPGQIMHTVGILNQIPHPSDADIDKIRNICRCGTYFRIREAIKTAAAKMNG